MPKLAWVIAAVLTTLLLVGLLGFSVYQRSHELDQAKAQLADAQAATEKAQAEASGFKDKLAESQSRIDALEKEKESAVQSHKSLEDEMRAALESKDVAISNLQGKLTVNILDRVLFDSGEAQLKPDGEAVLRKVAAILTQHPELKIHVIGHTDNVPFRAGGGRFPTNWELSTARATSAVRFLCESCGVDPKRLGAVGYGEFRPVADNSTPEGRARNRRIAITILPDELAGVDTSSLSTNAPPAPAREPAPEPAPSKPPED